MSEKLKKNSLCYELRLSVPDEAKDRLIDLLMFLGKTNFVEGDLDCDSIDFDYDNPEYDYYADLASNLPVVFFSESLEELEHIKQGILAHQQNFGLSLDDNSYSIQPIKNQDWRDSWKDSFKPVDVDGHFVIIPPWESSVQYSQPIVIEIDPGMAFGTGQHETTQLCLSLFIEGALPKKVLDVGTGSGVLAIGAAKMGVKCVWGNDIDSEAVRIAQENLTRNNVSWVHLVDVSLKEIPENDFDLIFANIQFKPLERLLPEIVTKLSSAGTLIISGILQTEMIDFEKILAKNALTVVSVKQRAHWMGIVAHRNS